MYYLSVVVMIIFFLSSFLIFIQRLDINLNKKKKLFIYNLVIYLYIIINCVIYFFFYLLSTLLTLLRVLTIFNIKLKKQNKTICFTDFILNRILLSLELF